MQPQIDTRVAGLCQLCNFWVRADEYRQEQSAGFGRARHLSIRGNRYRRGFVRRFAPLIAISAFAVAVPAWAVTPSQPTDPLHPGKPGGKSHKCAAIHDGYYAKGSLVSSSLTAGSKKQHFSGSITVDVNRANHKTGRGNHTFSLTNTRVLFGKGVNATAPAAGDHVVLDGKITELPRGCSTAGFTSRITITSVTITARHRRHRRTCTASDFSRVGSKNSGLCALGRRSLHVA
jgi:hypothetical protein